MRTVAAFLGLLTCNLALLQTPAARAASYLLLPVPALVARCAPEIHPQTLTAIISVESSGWPWALNDNTGGRSYEEPSYAAAVQLADQLVGAGHSVDLGIAQINSGNLSGLHTTIAQVFEPCVNVEKAGQILYHCYQRAQAHFGPAIARWYPTTMVRYALSCYNTGSLFAGAAYVERVVAAAAALGAMPYYAVRRPYVPAQPLAPPPVIVPTWRAPTAVRRASPSPHPRAPVHHLTVPIVHAHVMGAP